MYKDFYSIYPLFNIYGLYNNHKDITTWIAGLEPSLWKIILKFFKVKDKTGRVIETIRDILKKYKYYSLYEYTYLNEQENLIISIYYIKDKEAIDIDYITTLINLLRRKERLEDIVGWIDTNNNIICFIDHKVANSFYNYFGLN